MRQVTFSIESISPVSLSRKHDTPKQEKEGADAHEERTWREKAHYDEDGVAMLRGISFKMALDTAAKVFGGQIPGKGKATYTKHFLAGVMIPDNLSLGVTRDTIQRVSVSCNADGVRGSGKRVTRYFPIVSRWGGDLTAMVLDETIPNSVFEKVASEAGLFVGVGQYRPEKGGTNGRFKVSNFRWQEL